MYELALFAGAGGGILGGMLCGHTCIGAVEIERFPREVLKARQRDESLPEFPIWDDVTTFRIDNPECKEFIKLLQSIKDELIISGGFPCQDISVSGKGAGIRKDTRSGLWFEFSRIIREIRPSRVFVENSPVLTSRGLGIVLGDLAEMGYNAKWGVLGACDVGENHKRDRIWICAHSSDIGEQGWNVKSGIIGEDIQRRQSGEVFIQEVDRAQFNRLGDQDMPKPCLAGVENDVADRVDRLKAIGNGQVASNVYAAQKILGN